MSYPKSREEFRRLKVDAAFATAAPHDAKADHNLGTQVAENNPPLGNTALSLGATVPPGKKPKQPNAGPSNGSSISPGNGGKPARPNTGQPSILIGVGF